MEKGTWKIDREEASSVVLTLKADREQEVDWEARLVGLPAGLQADPIAVSQITKEDQELSLAISISEELGKDLVGVPIELRIIDNQTGKIVCRGSWNNSKLSTEFDHAWLIVPPANSSEE